MHLKIRLLKNLDRVLGSAVAACLPAPRGKSAAAPRRFLLVRPGGIGDAVLLIPALAALKEKFPAAEITVLAERRNAAAFQLCPYVDHLLLYDRPSQLLQAMRGGYDVVIDSEQWHRLSAVVARLTGAAVSVGFATNGRRRLFSHRIPYSHDLYEADSFRNLLAPFGMAPDGGVHVPFLRPPEHALRRAEELLGDLHGRHFVVLFPGASIAERRWGAARFGEVVRQLEARDLRTVVVGGKEDAAEGSAIVAGTSALNLAGQTSLAETAAVIARSALLLSGDSGVLHIAVGLGIPTVSLFGPGIEAKWGPKGEGHIVLNHRLPCSPCTRFGTTPPCPIGARCMREISVAEVVAAIEQLLARTCAAPA